MPDAQDAFSTFLALLEPGQGPEEIVHWPEARPLLEQTSYDCEPGQRQRDRCREERKYDRDAACPWLPVGLMG